MKRGEIWMADFGPPLGPEQAGRRPAIVVQDDSLTPHYTTVIVIPLTSNLRRLHLPSAVLIPAGEGGLPADSVALCHLVQARGKARLYHRMGTLTAERMAQIQDRLLAALGM
jgi:mRNA interferase MazF